MANTCCTGAASNTTAHIESQNRSIRAAWNEMASWIAALEPDNFADTHNVSISEAVRAIQVLSALADKLNGGAR